MKIKSNYKKPTEIDFCEFYKDHSGRETAIHFDISPAVVSKYARQYNIPRRSFKYKELENELTNRQIEVLYGSMLGDGCLEAIETNKSNSRFVEKHGIKQNDYLQWKCDELKPFTTDVKFGIDHEHTINNKFVTKKHFCKIQTCKHPVFTNLEKIWYNKLRIKCIPNDLKLTHLMLAVWFFDDGHNYKGDNITIYTNGFSLDEVKKLVIKLKQIGIENCHERLNQKSRGNKPEIYIGKSSCEYFLNIVKSQLDVGCMKYKLKGIL